MSIVIDGIRYVPYTQVQESQVIANMLIGAGAFVLCVVVALILGDLYSKYSDRQHAKKVNDSKIKEARAELARYIATGDQAKAEEWSGILAYREAML